MMNVKKELKDVEFMTILQFILTIQQITMVLHIIYALNATKLRAIIALVAIKQNVKK
jgi:hypothetical protein